MNKKILISAILLVLLTIAVYFSYNYFLNKPNYGEIESVGLNNISGTVELVEGNTLKVIAQVPDNFTPFSENGYKYINKSYILKITSSTTILLHVKDNEFNQLSDLSTIKPGYKFLAASKENIMDKNEIEITELTIYK